MPPTSPKKSFAGLKVKSSATRPIRLRKKSNNYDNKYKRRISKFSRAKDPLPPHAEKRPIFALASFAAARNSGPREDTSGRETTGQFTINRDP